MKIQGVHHLDGVAHVIVVGTFSGKPCRGRPGWFTINRGPCGPTVRHFSGWVIEHCGHPTALWPYAVFNADGELVDLQGNKKGFRRLVEAQDAVEAVIADLVDAAAREAVAS